MPATGIFWLRRKLHISGILNFFFSIFPPADFLVLTSCDILKTLVGMHKPERSLSAKIFFGSFVWVRHQMLTVLKVMLFHLRSVLSVIKFFIPTTIEVRVVSKLGDGLCPHRAYRLTVYTFIEELHKCIYHYLPFPLELYRKYFIPFSHMTTLYIFT